MTRQRFKLTLAVLAAFFIGGAFFYVNDMVQRQTVGRLILFNAVGELEKLERELEGEILQGSFFLYHNYDRVHDVVRRIKAQLGEVKERYRAVSPGEHPVSAAILARYEAAFAGKQAGIMRFLTANSTIKNSSMYIPVLVRKYVATADQVDTAYLDSLSAIASTVYLAKNGLDRELAGELGGAVAPLQRRAPRDPSLTPLHRAFVAHLEVFIEYFPAYSESLAAILTPASAELLQELRRHVAAENQRWLTTLNLISFGFLAAFLASIGVIIGLLVKTGRENIALVALQEKLTAAAATDRLTGLANRFAFDSDVEKFARPLLFLVNIDSFKHINDLYGVRAGDFVLRAVAARLATTLPTLASARLYRLGGDDFGILTEETEDLGRDLFAQSLLELIENERFSYADQTLTLAISVAVSGQHPLLETADMALREVKKQSRLKYLVYSEELNIQAAIAANLKTLTTIRHALEENGVLVYFQPIIDNRTGAVAKYECLMRLRAEDGSILAPGAFLDIAKESPLYAALTREVVARGFEAFRENDYGFSINLSVADILDQSVYEFIVARLDAEPEVARRLTFEILESEGVENYEAVHRFIRRVKEQGCRIAVDDFGAGYSNFAHILRLQVDSLKIDASLIRQLDTDANAQTLVRTIVEFCRTLRIETVAEFVHSAAVHEAVRVLGIDCSQGFHLGRPLAELPAPAHEVIPNGR